ncbi:hypothetical protein D8674_040632 [Pyrus ussuriensis x Pyrus communis]|uniref:Uncharacterized protein n=1 Tax=Pyrus ussuriensis x Pyrus communis TaxID=2448454 RepID=A0A5N5GZ28_9ROSA|nr:hypothetical protein D8674_040632 [Pyrus ussuriensis x Pyrus communis]
MVLKRYQDAKAGYQLAKSFNAEKYLKKVGLGKEDYYFWKQIGKALKELQKKKLEQEAQKLWVRMKNEVVSELQEKGYVVDAE